MIVEEDNDKEDTVDVESRECKGCPETAKRGRDIEECDGSLVEISCPLLRACDV